jgi:RNA-binding protein
MVSLTSKQRAHLRKLAHGLKPVVFVGTDGVTETLLDSVVDAFNTREVLKVKVQESAPLNAREASGQITAALENVHSVRTIGRTVVLYRPHPENPEIRLPTPGS